MYPCYDQFTFLIAFDGKASECTGSNQDNNKTEMRGTQNYHPNHGRASVRMPNRKWGKEDECRKEGHPVRNLKILIYKQPFILKFTFNTNMVISPQMAEI